MGAQAPQHKFAPFIAAAAFTPLFELSHVACSWCELPSLQQRDGFHPPSMPSRTIQRGCIGKRQDKYYGENLGQWCSCLKEPNRRHEVWLREGHRSQKVRQYIYVN